MSSPTKRARALVRQVARPLGAFERLVTVDPPEDPGLAELTGFPDGAPIPVPQSVLDATSAALSVAGTYLETRLPGAEVLTVRAHLAGLTRNAPSSPSGAFRILPAADGWLGLSLPRESDHDMVSALIEDDVGCDVWGAVAAWAARTTIANAVRRIVLLGLPGGPVQREAMPARRPAVLVAPGGTRRVAKRPLVVDLSALWAGPLCAKLLGLGGARVIKVESTERPDGARRGAPAFYRYLHDGHHSVEIDFATDQTGLCELLASADVVIEGSRPRALRQVGIDAHDYVAEGAVWVSITGYGRAPDDELRVGFGDDVAAAAGRVAWVGHVPVPIGDALADPLAGVHAAAAAAIALTSGRGALLDVSMYDVAVAAG